MRILSLAPSSTEILCALGVGHLIVGRTRFCDFPPEVQSVSVVGGWLDIRQADVEMLKPDVVMTSTFVQDKVREQCEDWGCAVLHVDPVTLDDVYESIRTIAGIVDRVNVAEDVIAGMREGFAGVKNSLQGVRVYVEEWHKPPTVSGNWVPDILDCMGAKGIAPRGQHSPQVSLEQIRQFDPDVMVLSWCGFGMQARPDWVRARQGWQDLRAVQGNRVFVMDDSLLNRPGPRLVQGAQMLCKLSVTSLQQQCSRSNSRIVTVNFAERLSASEGVRKIRK